MTLRRVQILVPGAGGGGGEVDRDRLIREGLEPFPVPVESSLLLARILQEEAFPPPIESSIVAAALIANELLIPPSEAFLFQAGLSEILPQPLDSAAFRAFISESMPIPVDFPSFLANVSEFLPQPVEITPLQVSVGPAEVMPVPVEATTALVVVNTESLPPPLDNNGRLSVSGLRASNAVVSQTAVTNPTNVLDTDADEATVVATASGVGGVTAVNVVYNLVVSFADFTLAWLDDITQAIAQIRYRIVQGGTNLGPSQSLVVDYSLNDGGSWTTFTTITTQTALTTMNIDLLSLVGDDWTKLNQLRIRLSGTIGSGTGLGANNTLGVHFIAFQYAAQKILT
jgi:hypothetical protein